MRTIFTRPEFQPLAVFYFISVVIFSNLNVAWSASHDIEADIFTYIDEQENIVASALSNADQAELQAIHDSIFDQVKLVFGNEKVEVMRPCKQALVSFHIMTFQLKLALNEKSTSKKLFTQAVAETIADYTKDMEICADSIGRNAGIRPIFAL